MLDRLAKRRRPAPPPAAPGRNGAHPRVLLVDAPGKLHTLPDVARELRRRGAELLVASRYEKHGLSPKLPPDLHADPGLNAVRLPFAHTGRDETAIAMFRSAASALWAGDPRLASARMTRVRVNRRYRKWLRVGLERLGDPDGVERFDELRDRAADLGSFDPHPAAYAALRLLVHEVERMLPPPTGLVEAIAAAGPDLVFVLSRCSPGGVEPDVLKAARKLGLPTVLLVWSWDNLSSKSLVSVYPDEMLVWNEIQRREAAELHGIPPERVVAVGSANFDAFFAELAAIAPSGRRADGPGRVLYLGSSLGLGPDEPAIFERWLEAVRASPDELVRSSAVVVRPHPAEKARWAERFSGGDGLALSLPGEGTSLAEALAACDVVVALNTSAELEAAAAGRPVLTFRAGESDAPGQEGSKHFEYLLAGEGGFVVLADSLDAHLQDLGEALRGVGDAVEAGLRFAEEFLRPRGLGTPVAPLVADAVLHRVGVAFPAS